MFVKTLLKGNVMIVLKFSSVEILHAIVTFVDKKKATQGAYLKIKQALRSI